MLYCKYRKGYNMNIQKYWDIVNNAETIEEIAIAFKTLATLTNNDIDNETYDDLMNALAYKSREAYRK